MAFPRIRSCTGCVGKRGGGCGSNGRCAMGHRRAACRAFYAGGNSSASTWRSSAWPRTARRIRVDYIRIRRHLHRGSPACSDARLSIIELMPGILLVLAQIDDVVGLGDEHGFELFIEMDPETQLAGDGENRRLGEEGPDENCQDRFGEIHGCVFLQDIIS